MSTYTPLAPLIENPSILPTFNPNDDEDEED